MPGEAMSPANVIIVGAGGHAAELNDYLWHANRCDPSRRFVVTGFLDDNPEAYARYDYGAPYLGVLADHEVQQDVSYLVGIAKLPFREDLIRSFLARGAHFLTFIHPGAYVSASARIGYGAVIGPLANIGPNVRIGSFTLINARCSVAHDSVVGDFNIISPNVCFSGGTIVGDCNLFGINSATIPGIRVGNRNKIMAGMVLDKPVGDDEVVFFRYREKLSLPRTDP